ncbi:MAG: PAS domain S-box protein [Desulfobacterales bacterium]|nr:PAS domain S-box protein [Desulfobacterales bacterium]
MSPWPGDHQRDKELILKAVESREVGFYEQRFLRPDGTTGYYFSSFQGIYDDNGKLTAINGMVQDITERKEIEAGLEKTRKELVVIKKAEDEAHEFADNIINTVREPLITLDQDLRVVTASRSFYDFFKVKPEETVGQLIYDLGNKQWDIPKLRELLETILPEKTTFDDYEVEHDFATIGRRTMLLNARQIERGMGKERIILLAFEDITERRHFENLLEESELRYRRIFETATDGIVLLEKREGHIVHANPAAVKMMGYSEAEYIGKMLTDIGVPIDMDDFPMIMESLTKRGILNYEDVPIKSKSGQDVRADIYLVDRAKLAQCNIRDITERKKAEKSLHESEERYRTFFEKGPDGVVVLNPETAQIIEFNDQACRQLGFSREEFAQLRVPDIEVMETAKETQERIRSVFETGCHDFETLHRTKQGEIRHVHVTAQVIETTGSNVYHCICRDITERKQTEDEKEKLESQLFQAQKMESVGRLAGGVAHDYNNMLSVILGYAELALAKMNPGDPLRDYLLEILNAAMRSADITRQLLTFARKQAIAPQVLDLNENVGATLKMLQQLIGEDIDLNWHPRTNLWPVKMDPSQLDQILANLCVNARDAIAGVGKVTIETDKISFDKAYCKDHAGFVPGEYVLLAVSDDGFGMDKETRANLFEPFFTTKELGHGTGLGLATIYGIVKQNDGFINVYSEPGKGTTFRIYLPRHAGGAEEVKTEITAEIPKGHGETVLIVEDEASILTLSHRILDSLGYKVLTARSPGEAMALAAEHADSIHLLLTDVVMPEMNGRDLSARLLARYPDIKTLFMSGYTSDVIAHRGVLDEGVNFVQKPFSKKDLATKVRAALDE